MTHLLSQPDTADRPDAHHVAAAPSQRGFHPVAEAVQHIQRHERLCRAAEAAAVDAPGALFAEQVRAQPLDEHGRLARPSSMRSHRAMVTISSCAAVLPVGMIFCKYMAEERPDSHTSVRNRWKSPLRSACTSSRTRRFSP